MATRPQNWEAIKALFEAALDEDPARRIAFLRERCADPSLCAEVERLLAEHEQARSFLSSPALDDFPIQAKPPSQRLQEGEVLAGRFRIVRFIAAGGMGEVYEAEDQELRDRVAIKVIRPEILNQSNAVARFKREVHLAKRVTHPNVCRIFDLFRHNSESGQEETVFISMELLHGKTLSERLKAGRLDASEALPVVEQMASALGAAHAVGIVHRDFKPGNVVLVGVPGQWRAVVTDFGLALRSLTADEGASHSTGQTFLGTPAYMSPEQLEGRPATAASDIYALGLVMYEMVTGVRPFQGDTPISAALKRLTEFPAPPRKFQPGLSAEWETVILRCLERDPTQRFLSAGDIAQALTGDLSLALRKAARTKPRGGRIGAFWRTAVPVAVVAGLLLAVALYYRSRESKELTEKDTIVIADFANSTGDPIFDDTLRTALSISLRQSPFLNVLPDSRVAKTLQQMTRPTGTKLTPDVVRELCQRAGSKAYIIGAIGILGSEYVLGLKAMNCQTGDTLAEDQVMAASKEKVLDALGGAASKLRGELGESLGSVQRFDVPLAEATTSSFEALKAYSLGRKIIGEKGPAAALPYELRAIELDPNFAMGYRSVGMDYSNLAEIGRAREYLSKAFQLREHTSEREKLAITASYYLDACGDVVKAAQVYQQQIESYPRGFEAYNNLGLAYAVQGLYEKALDVARQGMRLAPDNVAMYENPLYYSLALQRFDETRQIIREAQARKMDDFIIHEALYSLAFLTADSEAMVEQQQWFAGKPEYENVGLALASDTESYAGHLTKARELTSRAVDSALRTDNKENGAVDLANAALQQAAYGNPTGARQSAARALKLAPASQGAVAEAALALAMSGNASRAESLAQSLEQRFPLDTQMQSLWLPTIRAQLALDRKNPAAALNVLHAASPIELGLIGFVNNISCLYHVYVRGEAYLAAGQGDAAAAEFQKILDHSGIVLNCWTGALAHLGVARANVLEAEALHGVDADAARARAIAAYRDFLILWKDADPEIPILKQAKAEYAKLQ